MFESAGRTGRLLVVHEAVQVAGYGAEVAAGGRRSHRLPRGPPGRPRIPVGYAHVLEAESA